MKTITKVQTIIAIASFVAAVGFGIAGFVVPRPGKSMILCSTSSHSSSSSPLRYSAWEPSTRTTNPKLLNHDPHASL